VVEKLFDAGGDGDEASGGDFGDGALWCAAGGSHEVGGEDDYGAAAAGVAMDEDGAGGLDQVNSLSCDCSGISDFRFGICD
jgi:hypothetical protein